jgi:hypothetical protein
MLFTWSPKDLCIIFRQWHVSGPFTLFVSLVVIVLLTAGYEGVRQVTRRYEAAHAQRLNAFTAAVTGKPLPSFLCLFSLFYSMYIHVVSLFVSLLSRWYPHGHAEYNLKTTRSPTSLSALPAHRALSRTLAHRSL